MLQVLNNGPNAPPVIATNDVTFGPQRSLECYCDWFTDPYYIVGRLVVAVYPLVTVNSDWQVLLSIGLSSLCGMEVHGGADGCEGVCKVTFLESASSSFLFF